jgi:glycosyltransferase involved in cell wall biosynthesis
MTGRQLRVLTVADVSPLGIEGGAERVLWEHASRLVTRGNRVRVLSRVAAGPGQAVERQGVAVRHYRADSRSPLRFLLTSISAARHAVHDALAEEPADVLHCYQPFSALGALRLPAAKRMPALYTFLSPAPLEYVSRRGMTAHHRGGPLTPAVRMVLWAIERACVRRVERVHVLSDFSADQLRRLYRVPAHRVAKIPGGADLERFRPARDRRRCREALGFGLAAPLLLTVRNLESRMGLDALIRAMAAVRCERPDVRLLVAGSGSLRPALEALVASLDLGTSVRFLGYVPDADLPRYYQAADAFILPTKELEGFGLITVESLACGTPVLGTPVGATPEILTALDSSLLFASPSAEAIADGILRFLAGMRADPSRAEALRAACRRHAEASYGWETVVDRLDDELRTLVDRRGQP